MGQHINLPTSGTQCIGAYMAKPEGKPRGGIVVIQEIFGVTAWVRSVADRFADAGYTAIAPACFDHLESGLELNYDKAGMQRGLALAKELGFDRAVEDVASAAEAMSSAGRIGSVGYCWGGTIALLAAQRLGMPSVSYYGGRNAQFLDQAPQAPVMFHFGENDPGISVETVALHRGKLPQMDVFSYAGAGHAFNRDGDPGHYHAASAKLAWQRTFDFFDQHVASDR